MLNFQGDKNHSYTIEYKKEPQLYKKGLRFNLLIVVALKYGQDVLLPFFIFNLILFYISRKEQISERLVLIKNFGIQIEKIYNNGHIDKLFLDQTIIRDVIIQEYLTTYNVSTYLAIIVRNQLILPFDNFNLDVEQLLQIYHPAREMMNKI